MADFRWPEGQPDARGLPDFPDLVVEKDEEQLPDVIQGQLVDSTEEARVSVALDTLRLGYDYHVPALGGDVPGGTIIDFLVYTLPMPTPLYVQGSYWHDLTNRTADRVKQDQVRRRHRWEWADPQEVWDYEIPTLEDAVMVLQAKLGRG